MALQGQKALVYDNSRSSVALSFRVQYIAVILVCMGSFSHSLNLWIIFINVHVCTFNSSISDLPAAYTFLMFCFGLIAVFMIALTIKLVRYNVEIRNRFWKHIPICSLDSI